MIVGFIASPKKATPVNELTKKKNITRPTYPVLSTVMVSRLALARLAPVLGVARSSTSGVSRRTLRGSIRGYATTDNDHTVSHVMTTFTPVT